MRQRRAATPDVQLKAGFKNKSDNEENDRKLMYSASFLKHGYIIAQMV